LAGTAGVGPEMWGVAPGFRPRVLARRGRPRARLGAPNANWIGGHMGGGVQDWRQHYFRPAPRLNPYAAPARGISICSASTPPGAGVHGMCGYHAARAALQELRRERSAARTSPSSIY